VVRGIPAETPVCVHVDIRPVFLITWETPAGGLLLFWTVKNLGRTGGRSIYFWNVLGGYPCGDTGTSYILFKLRTVSMPGCSKNFIPAEINVLIWGYLCGDTCLVGIPAEIHWIRRVLTWGGTY
jgi:hypothetical protein